jgi:LCP family protein required for cell wall assembly
LTLRNLDNPNRSSKRSRTPLWLRLLMVISLVIFFAGGLLSGYVFYSTVRDLVAHTPLPALPIIQLPAINLPEASAGDEPLLPVPDMPEMPEMTPIAGQGEVAYVPPPVQAAEASERVNVLLLGIDRRGSRGWGWRTDTIIVVTVDPVKKTVGMLSIPRDLYVPIPGNGENRINTANVWGYNSDYPGGGPALVKRTIEANFDVPIDYYVMVDFQGFKQIVDTLGGIDVDVSKDLHDTEYPDPKQGDPYAFKTVHFDAGSQHMDGARALEYARSRMSTSDFDRAKRQQSILIAIRDRALSLNLLPKLPTLAATMANNVVTDMTMEEMVELAKLATQIDMANLQQVVLEKPLVHGYRTETGGAVQLPKWDLVNPVVDGLFGIIRVEVAPTPAPTTPAVAQPAPTPTLAPIRVELLQDLIREGARVAVQNGTAEPNFAAQVAARLMEQGYEVIEFGDADRLDYSATVIVDYTGRVRTLERLVEEFQVAPENVRSSPNLRSQVDIRVIVGQDYLQSQP